MVALAKPAFSVRGTDMTEAQLNQLYHELSRIEREIMEATELAIALNKENEELRAENERLAEEVQTWQWRATSLGGDFV